MGLPTFSRRGLCLQQLVIIGRGARLEYDPIRIAMKGAERRRRAPEPVEQIAQCVRRIDVNVGGSAAEQCARDAV